MVGTANFGGLSDVIINFSADTSGLSEGAQRIDKILNNTNQVAERSIRQLADSYTKAGPKILSLLDKTTAAHVKLEVVRRNLDKAVKAGQITQQQSTLRLAQESAFVERVTARYRDLHNVQGSNYALMATRGLTSTRAMGTAIQQAGFQVGDFAVQVASGQSAVRAFIQQGTQLISMFGPKGAVAGALLAIGGAIFVAFDRGSQASEIAKDRMDSYAKSAENLKGLLEEIRIAELKRLGIFEGGKVEASQTALKNALLDQVDARKKLAELDGPGRFSPADLVNRVLAQRQLADATNLVNKARLELIATRKAEGALLKESLIAQDRENEFQAYNLALLRIRLIDEDEYNLRLEIRKKQTEANVTAESDLGQKIDDSERATSKLSKATKELFDQREKERDQREKDQRDAEARQERVTKRLSDLRAETELQERLTQQLASRAISINEYNTQLRIGKELRSLGLEQGDAELDQLEKLQQRLDSAKNSADVFIKAQQKVEKEGEKAAEKMRKAWENEFERAGDALIDFIETGKGSFRDLVTDMLKQMLRLQLKQALQPALSGLGSMFAGFAGNAFGGGGSGITWDGPRVAVADGGFVSGRGGPRDDNIKAWLSNGEFVVNADATRRNRALLEAINSGKVDNRFADGGMVQRSPSTSVTTNRGGDTYVIKQDFNVSTGVSQTVKAELQKAMPFIEKRTVRAVKDAQMRGR